MVEDNIEEMGKGVLTLLEMHKESVGEGCIEGKVQMMMSVDGIPFVLELRRANDEELSSWREDLTN